MEIIIFFSALTFSSSDDSDLWSEEKTKVSIKAEEEEMKLSRLSWCVLWFGCMSTMWKKEEGSFWRRCFPLRFFLRPVKLYFYLSWGETIFFSLRLLRGRQKNSLFFFRRKWNPNWLTDFLHLLLFLSLQGRWTAQTENGQQFPGVEQGRIGSFRSKLKVTAKNYAAKFFDSGERTTK